jgi:arabinose-5-phosphate isomerase
MKVAELGENAFLEEARRVFSSEIRALEQVQARLDFSFARAVELILKSPGKVIVTGIGKSGWIGQKIASTLSSVGTPAVFLHAGEAAHGDLGIYIPGDVTIMITKSGSTAEIIRLVPMLRRFESPIIGILGNRHAPLADQLDVVLIAEVAQEADPLNLAPTSSTTAALVLGDALACALLMARGFTREQFSLLHPGGNLGRKLLLRVKDVMHTGSQLPKVGPHAPFLELILEITDKGLGATCVVDEEDRLLGLVTDGDVRRTIQRQRIIDKLLAKDIMTTTPVAVTPYVLLEDSIRIMENRPSPISVLPVVEEKNKCVGLVRLHDILQVNMI